MKMFLHNLFSGKKNMTSAITVAAVILLSQCNSGRSVTSQQPLKPVDDSIIFTDVQHQTFKYFQEGAEPTSGAARERFHTDNNYPYNDKHIVTAGGTGFGIMAW